MEIIPSLVPATLLTIPFVVTVAALHVILFRPLFSYLEEREQVGHKARADAHEMNAAANEKLASIERQVTEARKESSNVRQAARASAHQAESRILADARAQADAKVDAAVREIERARQTASITLRGATRTLSADIATQVLGRTA